MKGNPFFFHPPPPSFCFKPVIYFFFARTHSRFAASHPQLNNLSAAIATAEEHRAAPPAFLCNGCHSWQRPIRSSHPLCVSRAKMEGWSGWAFGVIYLPAIGHAARRSVSVWPGIGGGTSLSNNINMSTASLAWPRLTGDSVVLHQTA